MSASVSAADRAHARPFVVEEHPPKPIQHVVLLLQPSGSMQLPLSAPNTNLMRKFSMSASASVGIDRGPLIGAEEEPEEKFQHLILRARRWDR